MFAEVERWAHLYLAQTCPLITDASSSLPSSTRLTRNSLANASPAPLVSTSGKSSSSAAKFVIPEASAKATPLAPIVARIVNPGLRSR